jgi:hypothetical protein
MLKLVARCEDNPAQQAYNFQVCLSISCCIERMLAYPILFNVLPTIGPRLVVLRRSLIGLACRNKRHRVIQARGGTYTPKSMGIDNAIVYLVLLMHPSLLVYSWPARSRCLPGYSLGSICVSFGICYIRHGWDVTPAGAVLTHDFQIVLRLGRTWCCCSP